MLLGAILIWAPSVGAHTSEGALEEGELVPVVYPNESHPRVTNVQCGDDPPSDTVLGLGHDFGDDGTDEGISYTTELDGGVLHFHWASTIHDIEAVIVKQGDGSAVFSPADGSRGTVYTATGNPNGFSHIEFCWNAPVPELTVEKVVSGTAPSGAEYEIDVTRDDATTPVANDFEIVPGNPGTDYTTTVAGSYDIVEVTTGSADSTTWACFFGDETTASLTGTGTSIEDVVLDDEDVRCVFTNTYTPSTPQLTVEKVVSGTAPSGAVYEIDVAREGEETLVADNVAIAPGDPGTDFTTTGAGTYDIDEVATGSANSTSWACFVGDEATASLTGNDTSIEDLVVANDDVRCVFTNTYTTGGGGGGGGGGFIPEETPVETSSLQIVKAVSGDVPDEWTAGFVGDLGAFDVSNVSASNSVSGLTAGEYTVTEVDDPDSDLDSIVCTGADAVVDLETASVTVDLDAGDTAQCTFTNDYPEVLGDVVVQEPETIEPEVEVVEVEAEVVEVADETVVRTLPRTGSGTERLAGVGIALMAFGAVLVAGSQRRMVRTT